MDSLANYGSDGDNSDYSEDPKNNKGRSQAPRQESNDVNYDPVQMDMSEDSNNNHSSGGDNSNSEERGKSTSPPPLQSSSSSSHSYNKSRRVSSDQRRDAAAAAAGVEERHRGSGNNNNSKHRQNDSGKSSRRDHHRDKRSRGDDDDDRRREKSSSRRDERRDYRDERREKKRDRERRHSRSDRTKERYRDESTTSSSRSQKHYKDKRSRTRSRSRSKSKDKSSIPPSLPSLAPPPPPPRVLSYREEKGRSKLAQLEKLGIELKTPEGISLTSIQEPSFYNPLATATQGKYAEQIQKRKLLWANKAKQDEGKSTVTTGTTNNTWVGTTFVQDQDGKMTAKFKRLMGIKGGDGVTTGPEQKPDILKKQEEMFSNMEQQYEVARATTHTQRGVGLGYASGGYQFSR